MGKSIDIQTKRFAGRVILFDPLPYPVLLQYEKAAHNFDRATSDIGETFIPVILECVESWELKNFPAKPTYEIFPGTPRASVNLLLSELLNAITALYKGNEDTDPNA